MLSGKLPERRKFCITNLKNKEELPADFRQLFSNVDIKPGEKHPLAFLTVLKYNKLNYYLLL